MKHAVQVAVLGQQFTLKSEASPEEVARVVAFVNEKIAEVMASGRVADTLNVAILALLNIAAVYLQVRDKAPAEDDSAEGRLRQLLQRLEHACPDTDSAGAGVG